MKMQAKRMKKKTTKHTTMEENIYGEELCAIDTLQTNGNIYIYSIYVYFYIIS